MITLELAVIHDTRSGKYVPKIRRGRQSYNGRMCGSVVSAERDLEEFVGAMAIGWTHPLEGTIPGRGLVEGSVRSWAVIKLELL